MHSLNAIINETWTDFTTRPPHDPAPPCAGRSLDALYQHLVDRGYVWDNNAWVAAPPDPDAPGGTRRSHRS